MSARPDNSVRGGTAFFYYCGSATTFMPRAVFLRNAIQRAQQAIGCEPSEPRPAELAATEAFADDPKEGSQSRDIFFTIYDYTEETMDELERVDARALAYQEEICPTTHRAHLQGCIRLKRSQRFSYLHKLLAPAKCWLRRCFDLEAAAKYANKDDSRKPNGRVVRRGDFADARAAAYAPAVDALQRGVRITELARLYPGPYVLHHRGLHALSHHYHVPVSLLRRSVNVCVLFGPTGVGKSHEAYQRLWGRSTYQLTRSACGTSGIIWFSGYTDQSGLIIDDFDGWIPFRQLLTLLGDIPPLIRVDSAAFVHAAWTHVVITSDRHPIEWYPAADPRELSQLTRRLHFVEEASGPYFFPSLFDVPDSSVPHAPAHI